VGANRQELDSQDSLGDGDPVSEAAAVRARCAQRLERLGVRPGVTRRKLRALLRRQEGRAIQVIHDGRDGHLHSYPAAVSARIDRRLKARRILIWIADSPRTARAKHCEFHELAHLIVQPGQGEEIVSMVDATRTGTTSTPRFQCGCGEALEREVEATAGLLGDLMLGPLAPTTLTVSSGPGLVLARRAGGLDVL
jgi:hypothetical protein